MKGMKGQFFLAATFTLAIVFFIGLSSQISPANISVPRTASITYLMDNVKSEYPRAANLGLNESKIIETLASFTEFVKEEAKGRGVSFSAIFVLTENVSNNLNVTVGNFLGYATNVSLNVSGEAKNLYIVDAGANSTIFSSPPEAFTLGISFNTTEKNLLLEKYKANLYVILELRKGGNIVKGEVKS